MSRPDADHNKAIAIRATAAWKAVLWAAGALGATSSAACGRIEGEVLRPVCRDPSGLCPQLIWPNEQSKANTDPWLRANHHQISEMHPRVLLLHFLNGMTADGARVMAENLIAALREGSRHHGYSNPSAPAFLQYQIAKVVDLTDRPPPADWPHVSSTKLPTTGTRFDYPALFTAAFANEFGFGDPNDPGRNLTLSDLFERGVIHEVWLNVGAEVASRRPFPAAERKRRYQEDGTATNGTFYLCAGGGCLPGDVIRCRVTVRIFALNPEGQAGCDLQRFGTAFEEMLDAVPELEREAVSFLNLDIRSRHDVPFNSWYQACDNSSTRPCITYPTSNSALATTSDGTPWLVEPLDQGCGNTYFPPNARSRQDYDNPGPVDGRCEHFGRQDRSGAPQAEPHDASRWRVGDSRFPGCGGGWQIYMRQSFPGLYNRATASHGGPMKNWWPYLFY